MQVGKSTLNSGMQNIDPNQIYGKRTDNSDTFQDTLVNNKRLHSNPVVQVKEERYETSIREPIGRGYSRGHVLPPVTNTDQFRFGKPTDSSELTRKYDNKRNPK